MKILPYLSALIVTASCGATHSCDFSDANFVHIGKKDKHVRLINIDDQRINKKKLEAFFKSAEKDYSSGITPFSQSPGAVDLGMNGVPVLDQGEEGTCVTFSTTAVLDAKLGSDDFISQQCSLALDLGEGNNYWDGANYPSQIIDPLKANGVVEQSRCPSQYPDTSESITAQAYQALADKVASEEIAQVSYQYAAESNLNSVKAALKAGHRVLIAITINADSQEAVQGFNVVMNGQSDDGGLWACKQGSSDNYCTNSNAGHEVAVIGYDDAQQLLKIRNSWGPDMGDGGDYYMTYTFFNSMSVDQTVVQ